MRIEKKAWPELFERIVSGEKKFDVRLGDIECREGDVLVLKEFDPQTGYTGREIERKITYVLRTKEMKFWSEKEVREKGFVVLSLE